MSLVGFMRHLQQSNSQNRVVANKRQSMEVDEDPDTDSSFENLVKRAYFDDESPEELRGSSSEKTVSSQQSQMSSVGGRCSLEISGVEPLESTGTESSTLEREIDQFLDSVDMDDSEPTLRADPTLSPVLEDAIGKNVYWSACSGQFDGRWRTYYRCHFCSKQFEGDEILLEHFILEHDIDLMVF